MDTITAAIPLEEDDAFLRQISEGTCNATSAAESYLRHITGYVSVPGESTLYLVNRTAIMASQHRQCYFGAEAPSDLPDYIRSATTAVCTVILAIGVSGNLLVPVVVCHTKELRNSTNLFLINLSIADLLVLVVCMPPVLVELHSKPETWVLGEVLCKAVPYVELTVAHGSILTILAISFERYYAICKPLKAGYTCTKMRALAIILVIWVVALMVTSPILLIAEYTTDIHNDGTTVTLCLTSAHTTWQKIYFSTIVITFFWLPLVILVVIFAIIAKHLTKDRELPTNAAERSRMRSRKQVIFMLGAVVCCFFLCLMPFRLLTTWVIFTDNANLMRLGMESYYNLLYFCRVMVYINSAVNPILYNLISSKFRLAFIGALYCRAKSRLVRRGTSSRTTYTSLTINNSLRGTIIPSAEVRVKKELTTVSSLGGEKTDLTTVSSLASNEKYV